jgi:flagellin-specific chaperone FliS
VEVIIKNKVMKKLLVCLGFVLVTINTEGQIPVAEIIKAGIEKVIVAIDLKIQRLQTKTIWLQNAQKVIENAMSKLKLSQIGDWVQKQKDLYQNYFDELWKVKNILTVYFRVKEIINQQLALVREYHRAWQGVRQDGHFTQDEIVYIGKIYAGMIGESLKNLEQVSLVINSFTTQMSDARRMEIIDDAAVKMQNNYDDLRQFNNQNIQLSLQRSKDEHDISVVKQLYGIQ